ncbi:sodium/proline symporter PutP [Oceanobacillus sp. AG]|uniref:sodium/proline symporter PutP n=1 Tax=Oceanobacillus sp. AG TaxID=2681969 RepID=UPI0012EC4355|nr:sodium/proline symporter PutP [Oceanobacillus sp. AG]
MSDYTYQLLAIIIYFIGMIMIGLMGFRKTKNLDDYMLGGRQLGPLASALSAGASDMSQWLLMGLPGALYVAGLVEIWMPIGLAAGTWLNWKIVAPRLRTYTQVANNSITIPSFLDNRFKRNAKVLRVVSGIVILLYFTFYVSSGMVAGGVFFQSAFGYDYTTGLLIVGGVTILYTFIGGFLAVSYTDVVQGTMMFLALLLVPIFGIFATGGLRETASSAMAFNPDVFNLFSTATFAGVVSLLAWGLGYFGQPHIIIRFMAIKSAQETRTARRIGFGWVVLSLGGAIATGLVGAAYFQQNVDVTLSNSEAVFLILGQILFHPFIAGMMLAAVLAAIMSTVSSQLLVSSSALVEDIYKVVFKKEASQKFYVNLGRIAVLFIALIAIYFAWEQNDTILSLVAFAWAGFGSSFGPVILLSLYWKKFTSAGALWAMVVGAITVFVWGNSKVLSGFLYEIVPGFTLAMIVAIVVSRITYKHNPEIEAEFDEAVALAKQSND